MVAPVLGTLQTGLVIGQPVKSTEQAVPKRKNIAVVGVRIRLFVVVVGAVHTRSYNHPGKQFIQSFREYNIGVVKLGKYHRQALIQHDNPPISTHNYRSGSREYKPKHTFARMVAIG